MTNNEKNAKITPDHTLDDEEITQEPDIKEALNCITRLD
jgi:hypothetical protein